MIPTISELELSILTKFLDSNKPIPKQLLILLKELTTHNKNPKMLQTIKQSQVELLATLINKVFYSKRTDELTLKEKRDLRELESLHNKLNKYNLIYKIK